jgi:hypothetical protein
MKHVSEIMREMGIQLPPQETKTAPQFQINPVSRRSDAIPVSEHGWQSRGGLNGENNITKENQK